MEPRTERDALGAITIPGDRYWGAQTARSLRFFAIGDERLPREMIRALGLVKRAAAEVNHDLGLLQKEVTKVIVTAAQEVVEGKLDDHFPVSMWQTGSGTQSNMNANEVIANRAIELAGGILGSKDPVHPNDHVNLGQSSNDCFPTAMHIATVERLTRHLLPALDTLRSSVLERAAEFRTLAITGRTHLMDAVPLTLGDQFGAFAHQLQAGMVRLRRSLPELSELAFGGTAVGTGLNTHHAFAEATADRIASLTGLPFSSAANKFEAIAAHDAMVQVSGTLSTVASSLNKIANDVRLLASGPRCGLGEISLPANEPGSSIMPGKVNPTQCEAVTMVAAQVLGNHTTVAHSGASGQLQLNVHKPVIMHAVLQSVRLLGDVANSFARHCMAGIQANEETIKAGLERSLMLVTALAPHIGYDAASRVAHKAHTDGTTLRDAALALGVVDATEFDRLVDPGAMARPHRSEPDTDGGDPQ